MKVREQGISNRTFFKKLGRRIACSWGRLGSKYEKRQAGKGVRKVK